MSVRNAGIKIEATNTFTGDPVIRNQAVDVGRAQFRNSLGVLDYFINVFTALVIRNLFGGPALEAKYLAAIPDLLILAFRLAVSPRDENHAGSRADEVASHVEHHHMRPPVPPRPGCIKWVISQSENSYSHGAIIPSYPK